MVLQIALVALASVVVGLIAGRLLLWQWRPSTRPCWLFGHVKKWVAIRTCSAVVITDPTTDPTHEKPFDCRHRHQIGDKNIYLARWACRRCPTLGEDCLDNKQDWTIEHEELVPDVKKWANWSQKK